MPLLDFLFANDQANITKKAIGQGAAAQSAGLQQGLGAINNATDAGISYLDPFRTFGVDAGNRYSALLDLKGDGASVPQRPDTAIGYNAPAAFSFDPSQVQMDPGYQFAQSQAARAGQQSAFASGKGFSGAAATALQARAGDIANTYYGQAYGRQYGAANDTYARNLAASQSEYQRGVDAYGRQNSQSTDYLDRVAQLTGGVGLSASQAGANLQSNAGRAGADLFVQNGNNIANAIQGKAAVNMRNSQELNGNINNSVTDVLKALGWGF